jgi:hypothetical protein
MDKPFFFYCGILFILLKIKEQSDKKTETIDKEGKRRGNW